MKLIIEKSLLDALIKESEKSETDYDIGVSDTAYRIMQSSTPLIDIVKPLIENAFQKGVETMEYTSVDSETTIQWNDIEKIKQQFISQKLKELKQ